MVSVAQTLPALSGLKEAEFVAALQLAMNCGGDRFELEADCVHGDKASIGGR